MNGNKTLFCGANSLKRYAAYLSLSFLVACQQGQIIPQSEPTQATTQCDCSTETVDSPPPEPPPVCPDVAVKKPAIKVVLPPVSAKKKAAVKKTSINEKLVIGRVENVSIVPDQITLKARIDTGAGLSSINGVEITDFERDGQSWVRFALLKPKTKEKIYLERPVKRYKNIKQLRGKYQSRPIVLMSLRLGSIEEQVEMTVSDRTDYIYQILIGRNFLRDRAIVDVSDSFVAKINRQ